MRQRHMLVLLCRVPEMEVAAVPCNHLALSLLPKMSCPSKSDRCQFCPSEPVMRTVLPVVAE